MVIKAWMYLTPKNGCYNAAILVRVCVCTPYQDNGEHNKRGCIGRHVLVHIDICTLPYLVFLPHFVDCSIAVRMLQVPGGFDSCYDEEGGVGRPGKGTRKEKDLKIFKQKLGRWNRGFCCWSRREVAGPRLTVSCP